MESAQERRPHYFTNCAAVAAAILFLVSACGSQATEPREAEIAVSQELNKYPGLLPELGQLLDKLKRNVQFPSARRQSRILPLLPPSTTYYVALPNYGDAAQQALAIFREELRQSSVLHNWWQQGDMARMGPQLEDFLARFIDVSQYLGEEIVVFGATGGSNPKPLMIAELRKPGLKVFLQRMLKQLPDKSTPNLRVLDLQELASAKGDIKEADPVILVRPDFVIAAPDLNAVRKFNNLLETKNGGFASSPLGQRLSQAYQGGTSILAAGDLHTILGQFPAAVQANQKMLDRTGFGDVKYVVWDRKQAADRAISEMELSFIGSRRGVASWLAAPEPLGSLDFISPKAALVATLALKNPTEIFDDVRELSSYSNPSPFATLLQMEQAMHFSLRDDLLSQLQGEITIELESFVEPEPVWNVILRVHDPERLQKTLDQLFLSAPIQMRQFEKEGVRYHSLLLPSQRKPVEIVYAFADGYLIISSNYQSATKAIGLHKSGESLAKSTTFLAALPPGYSPDASVLFYEDAAAIAALQMRRLSPEIAEVFSHPSETIPITFCVYGEDSAIRSVSASGGPDPAAVLVIAAIAIPNLLRARSAANEASAVGTLRTVNTAQIAYSSTYPQKGYARALATLGPDPRDPSAYSPDHAGLIDAILGDASCTTGTWCTKSGYRFSLTAVCKTRACKEFVVVGTPVSSSTGTRTFCSTSDAVIRFNAGPVLTSPISASECREWPPIQ